MKLAVTAANGQLGSAIVKEAVSQLGSRNVIGIARNPEKAVHLGVEIRQGDYNKREEYEHALKGIEVVLLVSGMDTPGKRIEQHRNVINAARTTGVRKLVYTSIFGKQGKGSFDPIIEANRQTEQDIMESGLDWSIGRNGLYLEADLEYLDHYFKDGKISNCAGEGRCAFTSRDELARAYLEMITRDEFGTIISGIYEGMRNGAFEVDSDYRSVTGRDHISVAEYINWFRLNH